MRTLLLALCGLVLVLAFASPGQAQPYQGIACDDVTKSSVDIMRTMSFKARPGDTVGLPLFFKNDSAILAFVAAVQFDSSKMYPLKVPNLGTINPDDSVFSFTPWGRFRKVYQVTGEFGTYDSVGTRAEISNGVAQDSTGATLENVLVLTSLPAYFDPTPSNGIDDGFLVSDTIASGADTIAFLHFVLKPFARQNDTISFSIYNDDKFAGDTVVLGIYTPRYAGCYGAEMTQLWFYDNNGPDNPPGPDTTDITIWPTINPLGVGRLVIDSLYVPVVLPTISLSANPTQVSSGGSSLLSWTATNADSIVISSSTAGRLTVSTTLISSYVANGITVATTFTATAYKGTATATDQVTVTIGGTTVGNPPSFSAPTTLLYEVNEGEPVFFTVTASDIDVGNTVTLTVTSLPTGASFPLPAAAQTVTSNFTWTPDFGQQGTYQVIFTARDNLLNTTTRTVTIVVNELEFDRLFSLSSPPPAGKPVGGLRGTGGIFFPVNLVSSANVYGIQFDLEFPDSMITIDSIVRSGRIPEYTIYDNIGVTPGNIRVVTFGMNNEPVQTDTTTAIMYVVVTLDSSATPWTSAPMKLRNGRESVNPDPNVGGLPLVTDTTGIVEVDSLGDVNLDHYIDVADVVNIVAFVIGNYDLTPRQFATADVVINDSVNVFDLVANINAIYGIPLPVSPAPSTDEHAIVSLAYGEIPAGSRDFMTVASELPEQVAGVEMEIEYDPGTVTLGIPKLTADNGKFALQYKDNGAGKLKVLLYHMAPFKSGELIQAGTADLVSIEVNAKNEVTPGNKQQLRLTKMLLSTSAAGKIEVDGVDEPSLPSSFWLKQNYPNPFNPTTQIQFSIAPGDGGAGMRDVTLDVYNVLGQKVRSLLNGMLSVGPHTVEWDATSESGERVASGIYLYRLQVGAESQTRKMIFLK
ncbi:MAG: T9SS type A sorting domain-containing protein [bacterium]|nr:T9SS type A sorting domain-containing protein [bacterium]